MSNASSKDSFGAQATLNVGDAAYEFFRLAAVDGAQKLPFSLKVLLENLIRTEDGANVTADQIRALAAWDPSAEPDTEIQFTPARVVMQDFTGVPCVVDLATMREAVADLGGDPARINPLAPAEMVIDHSVIIDVFGRQDALERNMEIEYQRNRERYQFLRWGQGAFDEFKVVPPGTGIVHQVNIEYLARVVMTREVDGALRAYPDTCVGTDSHTTMVNGLGVLGWGVGGIEAEAAMLGQPVSMLIPRVVGFKLSGAIPAGATATDVVLTITEMLRKHGVVGKFVEFYGAGVAAVPLANRATIGNMSPEFGSTCAIFPIDDVTLDYLRLTGRSDAQVALVGAYAQEQGLWHDPSREVRLLRVHRARPVHRGTQHRRPEAAAGPHPGLQRQAGLRPGAADLHPGRHRRGRRRRRLVLGQARGRGHRLDHLVHQHLQPLGDDGRGSARQEGGREGADRQALGEDLAGSRQQGGLGLLRPGGADPLPGEARLPRGRIRLHHLHRQLGPAGRAGLRRRPGRRPCRGVGAVRQPELRGPDQPRHQDELPGLATVGDRLRAGRDHGHRPGHRAAGEDRRRHRRVPARRVAHPRRDRAGGRLLDHPRHVHRRLRRRVRRRRAVAEPVHPDRQHLRLGRRLDLRAQAPVLRRHGNGPGAGVRHQWRPGAGQTGRLGDHRPHQPGRLDQGGHARPRST